MSSKSGKFLENRNLPPILSNKVAKSVSQYRRATLEGEIEAGSFRDGTSPKNKDGSLTALGNVVASVGGINKSAQLASSNGGFRGGTGDTVRQGPEVYSPLWLNSNLNLPRDRATINAWCRSFYALNPIVHNAINLHSTYPISKLNIRCHNKEVERFFNDMIEETELMNVCVQIAQEFWLLGEAFVYAELDERNSKWSRFVIQNPDYIEVKRNVVSNEPQIMVKPDENLRRIVMSNKPSDLEQKKMLGSSVVDYVRQNKNIPLDNFHVSHLAMKIAPYETRGTGLPVNIFRQLMLFDKLRESKFAQADNMINPLTLVKIGNADYKPGHADLDYWRNVFECHDEETEVLTLDGFKKFNEVIDISNEIIAENPLGKVFKSNPKKGVKIACFNPENENLEYHEPSASSVSDYNGDMYHFHTDKLNIKVTPNHKLWVSPKKYKYNGHRSLRETYWGDWNKVEAKDLSLNDQSRFRSEVKWQGKEILTVSVLGNDVPVELYLEYLGYALSEGCLYSNKKSLHTVGITQTIKKYKNEMENCLIKFSKNIEKTFSSLISDDRKDGHSDCWNGVICGKDIYNHFKNEFSDTQGRTKSPFKKISPWIKELSPRLLKILLDALVKGDGSVHKRKNLNKNGFSYYSTSKKLADDVYEIAYKCGYVPTVFMREGFDNKLPIYTVMWSDYNKGKFPLITKTSRNGLTKEKKNNRTIENYNGKVWCFTVPTGLFITRREGKITVQGNSAQYDKDFKVFTHEAVTVEKIGSNAGIYDISGDITQLIKEMYIGLMVPPSIMDGGADTTYANAGVGLDVLRQRYMSFRNMLSLWLKRKIFSPISKLNDFYEYKEGVKTLIVPEIDWNHMSLFDAGDYITNLVTLSGDPKRVSVQTLYRSLGLEFEEENRKMRRESIQEAIREKEKMGLGKLHLPALRALGDEDEIPEAPESPIPGEDANDAGGGLPGEEAPPGGPGGGMPPPPPPPPAGPPA